MGHADRCVAELIYELAQAQTLLADPQALLADPQAIECTSFASTPALEIPPAALKLVFKRR